MKIVFWGTPEFVVPILETLHKSSHQLDAVVSQPDQKTGRKQILTSPATIVYAKQHQIPTLQPEKPNTPEFFASLEQWKPDVMIVAAYGKILAKRVLDLPKYGCINIHFSLLPKYRGASPVNASLLAGDTETGITIMQMAPKMDAGDIWCIQKTAIGIHETTGDLLSRLGIDAGALVLQVLEAVQQGTAKAQVQDESQATYCKMIDKKDGKIIWTQSAVFLQRFIRAMSPWPGAYSELVTQKKPEKSEHIILKSSIAETTAVHVPPGTVVSANKKGIDVATSDGILKILTLQKSGRNILTAEEFLCGNPLIAGDKFL